MDVQNLTRRNRRIARLSLAALTVTAFLATEANLFAQAPVQVPVQTRVANRPTYTYTTQPQPVAVAPVRAAQPVYVQPAAPQATYTYAQPAQGGGGDAGSFLAWLNSTRASYGLSAVGYDANLANWAQMNNAQQNARGLGHFVMGPARRQNSAMGSGSSIASMWMNSPAHRAALLDPTIRFIGLAGSGAYWTFNAY